MLFASFEPMHFIDNLKYMGLGMLGIFVVICLIALLTIILNAVTSAKKDDAQKDR